MLTFYHSPMSRSSAIATLIRELGAEAAVETRLVSIPRVDGSGESWIVISEAIASISS